MRIRLMVCENIDMSLPTFKEVSKLIKKDVAKNPSYYISGGIPLESFLLVNSVSDDDMAKIREKAKEEGLTVLEKCVEYASYGLLDKKILEFIETQCKVFNGILVIAFAFPDTHDIIVKKEPYEFLMEKLEKELKKRGMSRKYVIQLSCGYIRKD